MEKLHITVTDNETGETIVDSDTNAIIGALDQGDEGTGAMLFTSCNVIDLAATADAAIGSVRKAIDDDRVPEFMRKMVFARNDLREIEKQ